MAKSAALSSIRYVEPKGKKGLKMADIHWLPRLNYRSEDHYGTDAQLTDLARDFVSFGGWDFQQAAVAELASELEIVECVQHREKAHLVLKANAEKADASKPEGNAAKLLLKAFEDLYLDSKGKIRAPTLLGTTCNRRGSIFVRAKFIALQGDEDGKAIAFSDDIRVLVPDTHDHRFPDAGVRKEAQLRENEKDVNFLPTTDEDDLRAAYDLVDNYGKAQVDIRTTFGATKGLRLFFAVIIDLFCKRQAVAHPRKGWEKLKLVERFLAPKWLDDKGVPTFVRPKDERANPDALNFAKFQQAAFQGDRSDTAPDDLKDYPMGLACESDAKFERENKRRLAEKRKAFARPTLSLISKWISHVSLKGAAIPGMMKRAQVDSFSTSTCLPLSIVLKAVSSNKPDMFEQIKRKEGAYNAVCIASDALDSVLLPALSGLSELEEETSIPIVQKFLDDINEAVKVAQTEKPAEEEVEEVEEEVEA